MRKYSLVAILAVACWSVSAHALDVPTATSKSKLAVTKTTPSPYATPQAAGPCGQVCNYFEDFDDLANFAIGTWIGNGLNGAAGGIFETWSATCTSGNAIAPPVEGHVENANPFSGSQHVRISKDFGALTDPFGCILDARVPSSAVAVANPTTVGPVTVSAWIANHGGGGGANFNMQPQQPGAGVLSTRILWHYAGINLVLDDQGGGLTFFGAGSWDTTGAYEKYSIHIDPCAKFICLGGVNTGLPCANSLDCPGATASCVGQITYTKSSSGVFYVGSVYAGVNVDHILFYSDNTGGGAPIGLDVDDVAIDRDPNPCVVICGDNDIGVGEECEIAGQDDACPGLCVPPGGTGLGGEPECTCDTGPCSPGTAQLPQGTNTFSDHFGWWTFTALAPAYAVENCNINNAYDGALVAWTGTCDSLAYITYNDDCYYGPVFGYNSDPLASCFNGPAAYEPGVYAPCICFATNEGQEYWIWDNRVSFGQDTTLTVSKRLSCDNAGGFVACCDPFAGCVDEASASACDSRGVGITDRKTCAGVGSSCPPISLGACCDRLTTGCRETDAAGCTGDQQTFSLGTRCGTGVCAADKGACCVQEAFEGTCTITKAAACTGGLNHFYTNGASCSEVACGPQIIPTVSEWGLVIMALLLLVGAKVYFGRRQALA